MLALVTLAHKPKKCCSPPHSPKNEKKVKTVSLVRKKLPNHQCTSLRFTEQTQVLYQNIKTNLSSKPT